MKLYFTIITVLLVSWTASPAFSGDPESLRKGRHYVDILSYGTDSDIAAAFSKAREGLGEEVDRKVLEALSQKHTDKVCLALVQYIGIAKMHGAGPVLANELGKRGKNDDYRESVVFAMGELGERGSLELLISLYDDSATSNRLKKAVIDALGNIGDRSVEDRLIGIVDNQKEDTELRGRAVVALGELGGEKSFEILSRLLLVSYEPKIIRMYSTTSLRKIGGADSLEILGQVIGDGSHEVAEFAVQNIAEIGTNRAGELLMVALKSDYDKVRYHAAQGLSRVKYGEARDILKFKSEYDSNEAVRREAKKALEMLEGIEIGPEVNSSNES